eukprot:EG_transcript_3388
MATLPRELIKWLQSLDLSLPVKNAKRDFSNGYIVAEILARYWAEVSLHSFENGLSLQTKSDNWELLAKYCRKREVPLSPEVMDGVIHQRPGAAMDMIGLLYTALTGRELQLPPPVTAAAAATAAAAGPSYALPTAGQLLREAHPEAQHVECKITRETERVQQKNLAVLQQHAALLRQAKAAHPEHFKPKPRPGPDRGKGASKSERQVGDLVEIDVKNCPVLPRSRVDLAGPSGDQPPEDGVLALLSALCQPLLGPAAGGPPGDAATQFAARATERPRDVCDAVWARWHGRAADIADIIMTRPTEMSLMVKCLHPVWERSAAGTDNWLGLERLWTAVGRALGAALPVQSAALYRQHLLPRHRSFLEPHARTTPRWESCLRVLFAFNMGGPPACRLNALRQLRDALPLPPTPAGALPPPAPAATAAGCAVTYACCLAALARLEPSPSDELAQYFVDAARLALRSPSPTARAAGLSLLGTAVARRGLRLVLPVLEHLRALVNSSGGAAWEAQAQALVLCGALLDRMRQDGEDAAEDEAEDSEGPTGREDPVSDDTRASLLALVVDALRAATAPPARSVGLSVLAHHVTTTGWGASDPTPFLREYMALLAGLPGASRIALLAEGAAEQELPGALQVYKTGSLGTEWQSLAAAQGLAHHAAALRRGRAALAPPALRACLEVLALAVMVDRFAEVDRDDWWQVLRAVGPDLHAALRHPTLLEEEVQELLFNVATKFYLELGPSEDVAESLDALQAAAVAWLLRWPDL